MNQSNERLLSAYRSGEEGLDEYWSRVFPEPSLKELKFHHLSSTISLLEALEGEVRDKYPEGYGLSGDRYSKALDDVLFLISDLKGSLKGDK